MLCYVKLWLWMQKNAKDGPNAAFYGGCYIRRDAHKVDALNPWSF